MAIYRIHITMPDGSRGQYTGLFADAFEAVTQVLADFPQACRVSAMFVSRRPA